MKKKRVELSEAMLATFLLSMICSLVFAEEKIIQQEALSFEKCLNVIQISENKLSIAPEITDISNQKRVAIFTLVDGKLTITCDGQQSKIFVSTKMD